MLLRYCFDIVIISRVDIIDNRLISRFKWCRCVNVELTLLNRSLFDLIIYIYIIIQPTKKIYWIELAMSIQARFEKYFDVESTLRRCCASIYQNNVDISSIREIFRCWIDIEATLCHDIQYAQNYSTYNWCVVKCKNTTKIVSSLWIKFIYFTIRKTTAFVFSTGYLVV